MNLNHLGWIAAAAGILTLAGCTVHPAGEFQERRLSERAGAVYQQPIEKRVLPPLAQDAGPAALVTYALLSNADVEQTYWQWKSALEQVPQEGTQKTNLMLTYSTMISNGTTAASMNTLGAGSDTMNNIVLPDKLRTAAKGALENARAAGLRFDKARFDLRSKVLTAYYDYALTGELVRLEQQNIDLLELIARVTQSRLAAGATMQQDMLKASNELDMAKNEIEADRAKLPQQLAALNALLNRAPEAPLDPPVTLPAPRDLPGDGADLLALTARNNPELQALAREAAGKADAIRRAKQEYWPDFSINVSTDLAGVTQSLMGAVMLPVLRYQAIDAGVRQAQADLHAVEAMHRQAAHDLASRVVGDLAILHDAQRQAGLYEKTLLPRAQSIVDAMQRTYAAGQSSMLDLLDAQRSLIALRRMLAELKMTREKQIADLEAAAALGVTRTPPAIATSTPTGALAREASLDPLLQAYLDLAQAMGTAQQEDAKADPAAVVDAATKLAASSDDRTLQAVAHAIATDADALADQPAADQREALKPLSAEVAALLEANLPRNSAVLYRFHCPMAQADWLQRTGEAANPYMPDMRDCGTLTKKITASGVQMIQNDDGDGGGT